MYDVFELQKALSQCAQPPGFEAAQAKLLMEYAKPYVDDIQVDAIGNVICHRKGPGKKIMLPAHMDVIGFMATHIEENGRIRFCPDGGHWPGRLPGTRVRFTNGTHGMICPSEKIRTDKETYVSLPIHELYIDIGAGDRASAEKLVQPGDVATFSTETVKTANGCIITPYADDLSGCVTLLLAFSQVKEPANDLYFVFSVQEEVGIRGAAAAGYSIEPQVCIAIDGTFTGDNPSKTERNATVLGKGPTIKVKDGGQLCNPQAVNFLRDVAQKNGVAFQNEVMQGGTTDSSIVQKIRGGAHVTSVSIPMRNIHTCGEIYSISDVESGAMLLAKACETPYPYDL